MGLKQSRIEQIPSEKDVGISERTPETAPTVKTDDVIPRDISDKAIEKNANSDSSEEVTFYTPCFNFHSQQCFLSECNSRNVQCANSLQEESFTSWMSEPRSDRHSIGTHRSHASSQPSSPPSGSQEAPSSTEWLGQRPSADTPLLQSNVDDTKTTVTRTATTFQPPRVSLQLSSPRGSAATASNSDAARSFTASARSSFALERASLEANRASLEAFSCALSSKGEGAFSPVQTAEELSFDALASMSKIPLNLCDEFAALSILQPHTPAPASMLSRLWVTSHAGVDVVLHAFAELAIVNIAKLPNGEVWGLPHAQHLHLLKAACKDRVQKGYHSRLIDSYIGIDSPQIFDVMQSSPALQAKALASISDDGYIVANMAYHLAGCERHDAARALVMDPSWLERKAMSHGIASVVSDFRRYLLYKPDSDIKLILEAFQMSIGSVRPYVQSVPGILRCAMVGRLMTVPLTAAMEEWMKSQRNAMTKERAAARAANLPLCLVPQTPSLDQAGGLQRLAFKGHRGPVKKLMILPSGKDIISTSIDGTARIWDVEIGDCTLTMEGHTGSITDMAVTADNSLLMTASEDGTARAFELEQGQCLRVIAGHEGAIAALSLDPYGRFVVSGGVDQTVRLWDLASARALHVVALEGSVICMDLSPCTRFVVVGCADNTAYIIDTSNGRVRGSLIGHKSWITGVKVLQDSKQAVTVSQDGTLRTWSLKSGKCRYVVEEHSGPINGVALSSTGGGGDTGADDHHGTTTATSLAATAGEDGTICLIDVRSGACLKILQGHRQWVSHLSFSSSGDQLITASGDGTAMVWSVDSGEVLRVLEGHSGQVLSAEMAKQGHWAATSSEDGSVRVWNLDAGSAHTPRWHEGRIRALAVRDGVAVVTAGDDCVARLWDCTLGEFRGMLRGQSVPVRWAQFSSDGSMLVTASPDRTVCLWDCATAELVRKLPDHKGSRMKSFAANGDLSSAVICLFDSTVTVWDLTTGEAAMPLQRWGERDGSKGHSSGVNQVFMSVDGSTVLTLSKDSTARVWDVDGGTCKHVLRGHEDGLACGCLSADDKVLATHSYDGTIKLWNLETWECLATIPVEGSVGLMELSAFGDKLGVALSQHDKLMVFDMKSPEHSMMIGGNGQEITGLSFSQDGNVMVTSSVDCTVKVFDTLTGRLNGLFVSDSGLTCCRYDQQSGVVVCGTDRGVVHFVASCTE